MKTYTIFIPMAQITYKSDGEFVIIFMQFEIVMSHRKLEIHQ